MSSFGHFLRTHIDRLGLSQADFAARIGVDKSTISRWLKEERPDPDPQHIAGIAHVTGVPFAHIIQLVMRDQGASEELLAIVANPAAELNADEYGVLAQLRSIVWFPALVEGLVDLSPANARAVLAYVRLLQEQQRQTQTGARRRQ